MNKIIQICFSILLIYSTHCFSFDLFGHRGARGLEPENTLPAYQKALDLGVDYVDMDVTLTKDNVVVVQHDLTLNPDITRDKNGHWIKNKRIAVKNLTLQQIQQYDVGRIKPHTKYASLFPNQHGHDHVYTPTLKEVIRYVKNTAGNKIGFQIEIKTDPMKNYSIEPKKIAAAVAKVIIEENIADRTQVQAYDWRCLQYLQKISPRIQTAYITDHIQEKIMHDKDPKIAGSWTGGKLLKNYHNSIPLMVKKLGGKYWDPQDIEVTAKQIQEAHRLGLKVNVWSWAEEAGNDADTKLIKRLIEEGVDGIITDRPDIVKKI